MTDYATKMRKTAIELLKESGANHAAYGLAYKRRDIITPYGIREEVAEEANEIKLFFDDESFNKWTDELIKEYEQADIYLDCIYAVHKQGAENDVRETYNKIRSSEAL